MARVLVGVRGALLTVVIALAAAACGSGAGSTGTGGHGGGEGAGASGKSGQGGSGGGQAGGMGKAGIGGTTAGTGGGAGAGTASGSGGAAGAPTSGSGGGGRAAAGGGTAGSKGGAGGGAGIGGGASGGSGGGPSGGSGGRGGSGGAASGGAGGGAAGAAGTNTGWTSVPKNPLNWPVGDRFPWMVYDSGRGVVVLFLGNNYTTGTLPVWDLDVTTSTWTDRQVTPAPSFSVWPICRSFFGAAYDPVRARTFMFGGSDGNYLADFWAWDGTAGAWTNLTPPKPYPANWPHERAGEGLAYDGDRGKLVMFGGLGGNSLLADLWEFDPATSTWTNRTPSPLPAAWPGARQVVSMVYDQARKRVVMFGGDDASPSVSPTPVAELWEWDGGAGTWTNRTPASLPVAGWPSAREDNSMTYDATRGRSVFFGGQVDSGQHFWEWNGAAGSWLDRTPNPIPATGWPPLRENAGLTVVPGSDLLVLFGGRGITPAGGAGSLEDLWYWKSPGS